VSWKAAPIGGPDRDNPGTVGCKRAMRKEVTFEAVPCFLRHIAGLWQGKMGLLEEYDQITSFGGWSVLDHKSMHEIQLLDTPKPQTFYFCPWKETHPEYIRVKEAFVVFIQRPFCLKCVLSLARCLVAHTWNPSYSGVWDWEDWRFKTIWGKNFTRPHLNQ
jgi:hypothetical protein